MTQHRTRLGKITLKHRVGPKTDLDCKAKIGTTAALMASTPLTMARAGNGGKL